MKFKIILTALVLSCFVPAYLSAETDSTQNPSQMDLLNDNRQAQIGDRLIYQISEERESGTVIFVNDRGEVDLPLIGALEAKGKTPKEIAYAAKKLLEVDFFHQATVLIRYQFADNSRGKISVVGQVARPGPINVPADEIFTVSSAIIRGGGFLPGADSKNVLLKRPAENSEETKEFVINVMEIFENGNVSLDMAVRPDDIIVIPKKEGISGNYYLTGAVNNPGEFGMPKDGTDVTVSQAILRAGGFAKFANQTEVTVLRTGEENKQEAIEINVKKILEEGDRTNDIQIKAKDIIRVKEVLFAF